MPNYEYRCKQCGHTFEVRASLEEKEKGLDLSCPQCGSKDLAQVFSRFMFCCSPKGSSSGDFSGGCPYCS